MKERRPSADGKRSGSHPSLTFGLCDGPVCEAHSVLLNVQRGEALVVPQGLLLFAGDSQVKTQH